MKRILGPLFALVVLLSMTSTAAAAPTQDGAAIWGTHVVQTGETLFCLGRAYGVDPWAIARQNGIVNVNLIMPGVKLQIPNAPRVLPPGPICVRQFDVPGGGATPTPPPTTTPAPTATPHPAISCGNCTCAQVHTVVTGETLTSIAIKYNVNMWTIAKCNCITNLHYIQIGAKLCIPAP